MTLVHHIHRDHYVREMGRAGSVAAWVLETAPLKLLYRGSRFLTISNAAADDIAAHGIPREQIEMNYIGVELDAYAPGRRADQPMLLYLGRLKRYKRIELLLDVLEQIPEATLEMAGEGDHREAIEHEIARRGLAPRVRMHGHVSEEKKLELLQRAWVNMTASSAEGWCLTVMEAAACETPSVAHGRGRAARVDRGRRDRPARRTRPRSLWRRRGCSSRTPSCASGSAREPASAPGSSPGIARRSATCTCSRRSASGRWIVPRRRAAWRARTPAARPGWRPR